MIARGDRPHDLARRNPAPVVRMQPLDQKDQTQKFQVETIRHESMWALVALIKRLERRGEVRRLNPVPLRDSPLENWRINVVRLKRPAPAWRKPVLIGFAIGIPAMMFVSLVWWVMATLAAIPLASLLGFVGVVLVGLAILGRSGGGSIEVTQKVTIRR